MLRRLKSALDTLSVVLLIVVALAVLWRLYQPRPGPPSATTQIEDVHGLTIPPATVRRVRGSGRIVLVEFSDYECPFCATHSRNTAPQIKAQLLDSGAIRQVFFNFPLSIHRRAAAAAAAAECAGQQDHFWDMHDRLFEAPVALESNDLFVKAAALGLDKTLFAECLGHDLTIASIRADIAEGERLGVHATPAFFLGVLRADGAIVLTKRINGAVPFSSFKTLVDGALSERRAQ